jgi:hypothetical protein
VVGLVAVLALLTATGCVRMPDAGPVVDTRSDSSDRVDSPIYIDPKPPQRGDSPTAVVKGFLDAMTATPIETTVARKFLTADAASSWSPELSTITYGDASTPQGGPVVSVTLTDADRLNGRGAWRGPLGRRAHVLHFPMQRSDAGQWRIARAPDALIVPEAWFEQRFRQVSLYYFDPTARILVPEPVYVPRGQQLATTLTKALLHGPGEHLGGVSRSFIPPGLTFGLSVPVSPDGVADIALKGEAGQQTPQAIELMLAQLAWTLRQEPSIRALRVSIGGQQLQLPGGVSEIGVGTGTAYDPTGLQASSLLYGLRDGLLVSGPAEALETVDGPFGSDDHGLASVAVNLTATRAAAVSGDGRSLLVAPVRGRSQVREVLGGADALLSPAWDVTDRLWLVDRAGGAARVWYVDGDDQPRVLRVPGVSGRDVGSFLVSRDGSRFVAAVRRPGQGDGLVVSRIRHDGAGRVTGATGAHRVTWATGDRLRIRDLSWASPTSVAVLNVLTDELSQVRTVSVDGSPSGLDSLSTTLRGRVLGLAGSPVESESLYAVTRSSLLDLSNADRGNVALDSGVSSVDYAG